VIVFPADHFIWEEDQFEGHIRAALSAAEHLPNRLILLGAEANGPDPEHSWIALGEPLEAAAAIQLYAVRRIWEKPEPAMAAHLFDAGYLWNTRILAGRLDAYLQWAEAGVPEVLTPLRAIATCLDTSAEAAALAAAYHHLPFTSFSHALLARHPEAFVVLAARNVYWSDWGDPDEVVRTLRRFELRPTWFRV
jgi:mannose-1-phosphate guanylyltransferase